MHARNARHAMQAKKTSSVLAALAARVVVASTLLAGYGTGCSKKDDAGTLAPVASSLAVSKAESAATAWQYVIDPKSSTHVDLPGVKEHINADTTSASGTLDLDPTDLTKSRGLVRIDLTTFATHTFGSDDDATQTKHALTWLEVTVGDKTSDAMRWADFAIRSATPLDGAPADLSKVPLTKDGADDVREVSMTVHGDVLVHGHRVEKDGVVELTFRYPSGTVSGNAARPARIEIKSKEPMRLVLKELDVRPRDPAGALLDWTTKLISKVAETADVTVDLAAVPAPATVPSALASTPVP
jgi:hypothetical protein